MRTRFPLGTGLMSSVCGNDVAVDVVAEGGVEVMGLSAAFRCLRWSRTRPAVEQWRAGRPRGWGARVLVQSGSAHAALAFSLRKVIGLVGFAVSGAWSLWVGRRRSSSCRARAAAVGQPRASAMTTRCSRRCSVTGSDPFWGSAVGAGGGVVELHGDSVAVAVVAGSGVVGIGGWG